MKQLNVLIFDDHQLFTSSFSLLLQSAGIFQHVKECNTLAELNEQLIKNPSCHLFIDYLMPGINVLAEIKRIKTIYPSIKIVVVSSINNVHIVHQLHQNGMDAFISKSAGVDEIAACISSLDNDKYFISKYPGNSMAGIYQNNNYPFFTEKELQIIHYIGAGNNVEEIAAKMYLSKHTIIAHRRKMLEKFNVKSITSLLKIAIEMQLLPLRAETIPALPAK